MARAFSTLTSTYAGTSTERTAKVRTAHRPVRVGSDQRAGTWRVRQRMTCFATNRAPIAAPVQFITWISSHRTLPNAQGDQTVRNSSKAPLAVSRWRRTGGVRDEAGSIAED